MKKLQERYKFLKVPTTVEELFPVDPSTHPIKFEQGRFTRDDKSEVVIESFLLLPNALVAQTHTSTDDAEAFLKDYIDDANKESTETITPIRRTALCQPDRVFVRPTPEASCAVFEIRSGGA